MIKKYLIKSLYFFILANLSLGATTDEIPNTIITKNPKREVNTIRAPKNRENAKMNIKINKVPIEEIEASQIIRRKKQSTYKIKKENGIKERSSSKEKIVVTKDMDTLNKLVEKKITLDTLKELVINKVLEKDGYKQIDVNTLHPVYIGVFNDDILTKVYSGTPKIETSRKSNRVPEGNDYIYILNRPAQEINGFDGDLMQIQTPYPIITKRICLKGSNRYQDGVYTTIGTGIDFVQAYGDPTTGIDEYTEVEINHSSTASIKDIIQPAGPTSAESGGINGRRRSFIPGVLMSYNDVTSGKKVTVNTDRLSIKLWFTGRVESGCYGDVFNHMNVHFELTPKAPYRLDNVTFLGEVQITTTLTNTYEKSVQWGIPLPSSPGYSDPRPGPWFDISYQFFGLIPEGKTETSIKEINTLKQYADVLTLEGTEWKVNSYDINNVIDIFDYIALENKLSVNTRDCKETVYIKSIAKENNSDFYYIYNDKYMTKLKLSRLPENKARLEVFIKKDKEQPPEVADYATINDYVKKVGIHHDFLTIGRYKMPQLNAYIPESHRLGSPYWRFENTLNYSEQQRENNVLKLIKIPQKTGKYIYRENIGYKLPAYMINKYYGIKTSQVNTKEIMYARHNTPYVYSLTPDITKLTKDQLEAKTTSSGNISTSTSTPATLPPEFQSNPEYKEERVPWIAKTDIVNGTREITFDVKKVPKLEINKVYSYKTDIKFPSPMILQDSWNPSNNSFIPSGITFGCETTGYDLYETDIKIPYFDFSSNPDYHKNLGVINIDGNSADIIGPMYRNAYTIGLVPDKYAILNTSVDGKYGIAYKINVDGVEGVSSNGGYLSFEVPGKAKILVTDQYTNHESSEIIIRLVNGTDPVPVKIETQYRKRFNHQPNSVGIGKDFAISGASVEFILKFTEISLETVMGDSIDLGYMVSEEEKEFSTSSDLKCRFNVDLKEVPKVNIPEIVEITLEGKDISQAKENEKIKLRDIRCEGSFDRDSILEGYKKVKYKVTGKAIAPPVVAPGKYKGEINLELVVTPLH